MEQRLRESETRYRSLFEQVPIGLFRTTPAGRILNINQAVVSILGYPDHQTLLTQKATTIYVNPQDREAMNAALKKNAALEGLETQFYRYYPNLIRNQWTATRAMPAAGAGDCRLGSPTASPRAY